MIEFLYGALENDLNTVCEDDSVEEVCSVTFVDCQRLCLTTVAGGRSPCSDAASVCYQRLYPCTPPAGAGRPGHASYGRRSMHN